MFHGCRLLCLCASYFLEYFCAWEFVWQFKETQTLSLEKLKTEVFGKHWQDESWHEVLRLIAGMIEPKFTGEIIDYLIEQNGKKEKFANIFLAEGCLAEVRNFSMITETAAKLLKSLEQLAKHNSDTFTSKSILLLPDIWKDSLEVLQILESLLKFCSANYNNYDVGRAVIQAIILVSKVNPEALSILKSFTHSLYKPVRQAPVPSHFSTLRTKITDAELLKSALRDLGIEVKTNHYIRGYKGQRMPADIVAVLRGEYDIGWLRNSDGTYDLCAELAGISQGYSQTELFNLINYIYPFKKILGDS